MIQQLTVLRLIGVNAYTSRALGYVVINKNDTICVDQSDAARLLKLVRVSEHDGLDIPYFVETTGPAKFDLSSATRTKAPAAAAVAASPADDDSPPADDDSPPEGEAHPPAPPPPAKPIARNKAAGSQRSATR